MMKSYGQFCGLAKASGLVGERWTLLIIRDLSVAARRFKDLHEGLPGIPTSVLTTRLRDLQAAGVVERVAEGHPGGSVLYRLSPHGQELVPILDALGRWGAATMTTPEPGDVITGASLAAALRTGYQQSAASSPITYAVVTGDAQAWAETASDALAIGTGLPPESADLTIHGGPELRTLLAGALTADDALSSGAITIDGPPELLERFAQTFRVPWAETIDA